MASWAPFQYPIRRLIVRYRKDSKSRDLHLELYDPSEIWQTPRQQRCWCACQISKRCKTWDYQSHRFETWDISNLSIDVLSDIETGPWSASVASCIIGWSNYTQCGAVITQSVFFKILIIARPWFMFCCSHCSVASNIVIIGPCYNGTRLYLWTPHLHWIRYGLLFTGSNFQRFAEATESRLPQSQRRTTFLPLGLCKGESVMPIGESMQLAASKLEIHHLPSNGDQSTGEADWQPQLVATTGITIIAVIATINKTVTACTWSAKVGARSRDIIPIY